MSDELKLAPCPFCGSENVKAFAYDYVIDGEPDAYCQCQECSVTGPNGKNEAEAIAAWNRRDTPSPSTAPTEQNQAADLNVLPPFAAPAGQLDASATAYDLADGLHKFVELAISELFSGKEHKAVRHDLRNLAKSFKPEYWQVSRCRAQGGNTSTNSSEFSGIKLGSTAPIAEDERAAFEAWARDHLGQGYPLTMDEHTYEHAVTRWAFKAWQAGRAPKPAAREAARQSIDTPEFADLLKRYHNLVSPKARQKAYTALIAHINTWGGAVSAQPLAYIAPHVMESLRAGCQVATVLSPKPDDRATEALYGR